MARRTARKTGNGRLEEALATLINNQAQFVGQMGRMEENYARIREDLGQIKNILFHHERILNELPEAIREKIGFQKPR